jgi:hypothetical protein
MVSIKQIFACCFHDLTAVYLPWLLQNKPSLPTHCDVSARSSHPPMAGEWQVVARLFTSLKRRPNIKNVKVSEIIYDDGSRRDPKQTVWLCWRGSAAIFLTWLILLCYAMLFTVTIAMLHLDSNPCPCCRKINCSPGFALQEEQLLTLPIICTMPSLGETRKNRQSNQLAVIYLLWNDTCRSQSRY